jgi:hypothetical protein
METDRKTLESQLALRARYYSDALKLAQQGDWSPLEALLLDIADKERPQREGVALLSASDLQGYVVDIWEAQAELGQAVGP